MGMNYKDIYKQAMNLEHKLKDRLDDRNHPLSQQLIRQTKEVSEDLESQKDPRSVESRIREVQKLLIQARADGTAVLNPEESDMLHDAYEDLREDLRGLPNY